MQRANILCAIVVFAVAYPISAQDTLDEVANAAFKSYRNAETTTEKVKILKDFLSTYPESRHTPRFLTETTKLISNDLDDLDGAVGYACEITDKVVDKQIKADTLLVLINLYGNPRYRKELVKTVNEISALTDIRFDAHWRSIIAAAIDAGDWEAVLKYCSQSESQANLEAFKAEHPNRAFPKYVMKGAGNHRKGLLLLFEGRALAALGKRNKALESFDAADKLLIHNYYGLPYEDLWYHMGAVLLETGEHERALEKLIPHAMYSRNLPPNAAGKILEAYANLNHGIHGFEDFMLAMRRKYSKQIHDFQLPDFSGKMHSFLNLKGDATILSFWSPY